MENIHQQSNEQQGKPYYYSSLYHEHGKDATSRSTAAFVYTDGLGTLCQRSHGNEYIIQCGRKKQHDTQEEHNPNHLPYLRSLDMQIMDRDNTYAQF